MIITDGHYNQGGRGFIRRLTLEAITAMDAGIYIFGYLSRPLQRGRPGPHPAIIIEGLYSEGDRDLIRRLLLKAITAREAATFAGDYY